MEAAAPARGTRILVLVATLVAVTNMIDFIFHGKHVYDLLAAIGMALVAHAAYHDGFRPISEMRQRTGAAALAYHTSIGGALLMIASILLKYAF
ncbi:MAG TPA: hypothetical protein VL118_09920 [Luteimonas sp.]|jgi:hypothetical protein|nr:hypothetical protein [Luteimonas sp.]